MIRLGPTQDQTDWLNGKSHCGKGNAASQWEMAILGCQNSVTPEPIGKVQTRTNLISHSLSPPILMAILPGEPGVASFIGAKDDGSVVTTGAVKCENCKAPPVKSSSPTNQHPIFYRPDALPVAQPTVSKH